MSECVFNLRRYLRRHHPSAIAKGWLTALRSPQDLGQRWRFGGVAIAIALLISMTWGIAPAQAVLDDDHYDGNIFALYSGNGAIVPPRLTLAQALEQGQPTVLVLYVDDSRDCKLYTTVVSKAEAFYGRVAAFIPFMADAIPSQATYAPDEPGYYFTGAVPQTVIFDQSGQVVLNEVGNIAFETVDDTLRDVFNLLPREESVELRRRPVNEVNTELVPVSPSPATSDPE